VSLEESAGSRFRIRAHRMPVPGTVSAAQQFEPMSRNLKPRYFIRQKHADLKIVPLAEIEVRTIGQRRFFLI
jgi:hypothetical protein